MSVGNKDFKTIDNRLSVDIATKVVDNYGDAAVALRFLRSLVLVERDLRVRLFIDIPSVLEQLTGNRWVFTGPGSILRFGNFSAEVFDWSELPSPSKDLRPDLLIEMFGGGLPPLYLETQFHGYPRRKRKTLWINLEHLTAEEWAADFHLTRSWSPDPDLERFFFMPGFREGLGGLLIDPVFTALKNRWDNLNREQRNRERGRLLERWGCKRTEGLENRKWISIFSYTRDFSALIDQIGNNKLYMVLLSPGPGSECFIRDLEKNGKTVHYLKLPFLPQDEWDELVLSCDINLVRGEESLSRAALSGRPFLWQAYRIEDGAHMDKVTALCSLLCPGNKPLYDLFVQYNRDSGEEDYSPLLSGEKSIGSLYEIFAKKLEIFGNCIDQLILFFDNYIKLSESS